MLKVNAANKLMIVAHPDDEIIFGAGTLLSESGWKVTCITNGNNPVRRMEFQKAMKLAGCDYEMWEYADQPYDNLDSEIEDRLEEILERPHLKVVTHNDYGEYRHRHHIQIHNIVNSILGSSFYVFCQGEPLPLSIWKRKLRLMACYKSQSDMCHRFLEWARREAITKMI